MSVNFLASAIRSNQHALSITKVLSISLKHKLHSDDLDVYTLLTVINSLQDYLENSHNHLADLENIVSPEIYSTPAVCTSGLNLRVQVN